MLGHTRSGMPEQARARFSALKNVNVNLTTSFRLTPAGSGPVKGLHLPPPTG